MARLPAYLLTDRSLPVALFPAGPRRMEISAPRVNLEEKEVKGESSELALGFLERAVRADWTDLRT